jgi:hypothetical protein
MSSDKTHLYVITSIVIACVIILGLQCNMKTYNYSNEKILVDTKDGLIKSDRKSLANELELLHNHLKAHSIADINEDLIPEIKKSIDEMNTFIKLSPKNGEVLCQTELKTQLIHKMENQMINPELNTITLAYQSELELEDTERKISQNPKELFKFLLKNMHITVKLLRAGVCENGRINVERLHEILLKLNQSLEKTGKMPIYTEADSWKQDYRAPSYTPFPFYKMSVEPFASSRETIQRYVKPIHETVNVDREPEYLEGLFRYGDIPLPKKKGVFNGFEGTVVRDIAENRTPGELISQLYDPKELYTSRVNVCGGNTVPDDLLVRDCIGPDISLRAALDGNPYLFMTDIPK